MKRIGVFVMMIVGIGCGSDSAAFSPTTNVTGSGPGGTAAASYEIRMGHDQPAHVRVNVWSHGAWVEDGRTMARVGIEVLNTGELGVSVDTNALRLDAYRNDGAQLPSGQLVRTSVPDRAGLVVAPNETGVVSLDFALPAEVKPDEIGNLRLRWAVAHDDGRRYVQFTDFQRVRQPYATTVIAYDPIWGYYDPFFYGPPYGYHLRYRVPVGRVIIDHRRGQQRPRTVIRDR